MSVTLESSRGTIKGSLSMQEPDCKTIITFKEAGFCKKFAATARSVVQRNDDWCAGKEVKKLNDQERILYAAVKNWGIIMDDASNSITLHGPVYAAVHMLDQLELISEKSYDMLAKQIMDLHGKTR